MNFIEYSIQWAKGEQYEGICIAIEGVLTLVLAFALWKYGSSLNAKSLVIPSLIFGLTFTLMGAFMIYSNAQRQVSFRQSYEISSEQFIKDEKMRVEDFQFMYPASLAISAICFLVTLVAFVWADNSSLHAIGIILSVFGLSLIVIDYFSKERAMIYYQHILEQLP